MSIRPILVALSMSALFACQRKAANPGPLSEADRSEMRARVASFDKNVLAADWPKVVLVYSEDGILLPPNAPAVQGRAAMQKLFEGWPKLTGFKESLIELEGYGDLAYGRGTYEMTMIPPGGKAPLKDTGKTLGIWQRQGDGSWRVSRVSWSSDLPAGR